MVTNKLAELSAEASGSSGGFGHVADHSDISSQIRSDRRAVWNWRPDEPCGVEMLRGLMREECSGRVAIWLVGAILGL